MSSITTTDTLEYLPYPYEEELFSWKGDSSQDKKAPFYKLKLKTDFIKWEINFWHHLLRDSEQFTFLTNNGKKIKGDLKHTLPKGILERKFILKDSFAGHDFQDPKILRFHFYFSIWNSIEDREKGKGIEAQNILRVSLIFEPEKTSAEIEFLEGTRCELCGEFSLDTEECGCCGKTFCMNHYSGHGLNDDTWVCEECYQKSLKKYIQKSPLDPEEFCRKIFSDYLEGEITFDGIIEILGINLSRIKDLSGATTETKEAEMDRILKALGINDKGLKKSSAGKKESGVPPEEKKESTELNVPRPKRQRRKRERGGKKTGEGDLKTFEGVRPLRRRVVRNLNPRGRTTISPDLKIEDES